MDKWFVVYYSMTQQQNKNHWYMQVMDKCQNNYTQLKKLGQRVYTIWSPWYKILEIMN